ncbi:MAG: hypothetical protein BWY65_01985 [Firmicutes bacterium ADurb.Bin373]|nr:MAG: hypothetical protein BWY65_01985 [Firmicutes bacterium ADurb.Bin373]
MQQSQRARAAGVEHAAAPVTLGRYPTLAGHLALPAFSLRVVASRIIGSVWRSLGLPGHICAAGRHLWLICHICSIRRRLPRAGGVCSVWRSLRIGNIIWSIPGCLPLAAGVIVCILRCLLPLRPGATVLLRRPVRRPAGSAAAPAHSLQAGNAVIAEGELQH